MNLKLILLLPIFEIIVFVLFGDFFGFFPVVFMILVTGFFGLLLLKSSISIKDVEELASNPQDWMYKKIAGILLIIPGFVTDLLGLILLTNSLRKFVWDFIPEKVKVYSEKDKQKKDEVIEVEYRDLDEK
jgi:UPF0716 protein FxsA